MVEVELGQRWRAGSCEGGRIRIDADVDEDFFDGVGFGDLGDDGRAAASGWVGTDGDVDCEHAGQKLGPGHALSPGPGAQGFVRVALDGRGLLGLASRCTGYQCGDGAAQFAHPLSVRVQRLERRAGDRDESNVAVGHVGVDAVEVVGQGVLSKLPDSVSNVYSQIMYLHLLWSFDENGTDVNGGSCKLTPLTSLDNEREMQGLGYELTEYYAEFLALLEIKDGENPLDSIHLLERKMGLGGQTYVLWIQTSSKPEGGLWFWRSDGPKFPLSIDFESYIARVIQYKGQFKWEYFFIELE